MRITPNITSQNSLYNIQQSRTLLDSIQEKIASGKNYNRPSDDPVAARLLVGLGDQLKDADQYSSSMTKSNIWLNVTATGLQGMSSAMGDIKKLISTLTNGTDIPEVRQNAVSQLETYKKALIDYGNTEMNGLYVFGGTNSQVKPFNGSVYSGDDNSINIEISSSSTQTMNVTGGRVLKGTNLAPNQYGSTDILTALDNLIIAVGANDLPNIKAGAQLMENGAQQINNAIADVGGRLKRLDTTQAFNSNIKNTIQGVVANVQNADYAKLAIELQQQTLAFQATLSSTAKVTQMSLLDYL